jgi:serine/threonine protein kinase
MQARKPHTLPYIPKQVDLSDLQSNGKLLTDEQITAVKRSLNESKNGRYKKQPLNLDYDIVKIDDQFYAIYKGKKHKKELGSGKFGLTKLSQNLTTGEWTAIKIIVEKQEESKPIKKEPVKKEEKKKDEKGKSHKSKKILAPEQKKPKKEVTDLLASRQITSETDILAKRKQLHGFYERTNKSGLSQKEIIMTLAKGDSLAKLSDENTVLPPILYWQFIFLILEQIISLLEMRILHRDIKPLNVIASIAESTLQLVDHGIAALLLKRRNDYPSQSSAGTDRFMAPEITKQLAEDELYSYNESTEIYAAGITIKHLLGFIPHGDNDLVPSMREMNASISNVHVLEAVQALISEMTAAEPKDRPTAKSTLAKFKDTAADNLDDVSRIIMLGVLDLNAYCSASTALKKAFHKALFLSDKIILLDKKGEHAAHYLTVRRELEKQHFTVLPDVIQYDDRAQELPLAIDEYVKQKEAHPMQVNRVYFLTDSHEEDILSNLGNLGILTPRLPLKDFDKQLFARSMGLPVREKTLNKFLADLEQEKKLMAEKSEYSGLGKKFENVIALARKFMPMTSYGLLINQLTLLARACKPHKSKPFIAKRIKAIQELRAFLEKDLNIEASEQITRRFNKSSAFTFWQPAEREEKKKTISQAPKPSQ